MILCKLRLKLKFEIWNTIDKNIKKQKINIISYAFKIIKNQYVTLFSLQKSNGY